MRLFDRRTRLQRLFDDTRLDVPSGKAAKAGLIAAGSAGLIAASAGISSLRRRRGEAADD